MEREEENGEKLSGKEGFLREIENDRVKENMKRLKINT